MKHVGLLLKSLVFTICRFRESVGESLTKQMLLSAKWTGRQTFNLEIRVRSSVGVPNNAVTCHHEDGAANIPVNVAAGILWRLITSHVRADSLPVLPHQIRGR